MFFEVRDFLIKRGKTLTSEMFFSKLFGILLVGEVFGVVQAWRFAFVGSRALKISLLAESSSGFGELAAGLKALSFLT